jgi:hypothetical protein
MCTVTFIARKNGYALGMNRDEQLSRVKALPPSRQKISGRTVLLPSEPNGGTWIGVNDAGITFALINWHSVQARVSANAVSRGQLVRVALAADKADSIGQILAGFPLSRTNPFRLIGVFHDAKEIVEWRWSRSTLHRVAHDWKSNVWISSGFDEAGAQGTRRLVFERLIEKKPTHDVRWIRGLHSSHSPGCGPYSVCMHRSDAATVSYTEVAVSGWSARMRYSAGPLCCNRVGRQQALRLRSGVLRDSNRTSPSGLYFEILSKLSQKTENPVQNLISQIQRD